MIATKRTQVERTREAISHTVDEVTTFLMTTADEWEEYHLYVDGRPLSPMRFDGAVPFNAPELVDPDETRELFSDVAPDDLSRPIDVSFIGALFDDDDRPIDGMVLHRVRKVSLEDVRGKVRHYSRHMVSWDYVMIPNQGDCLAVRSYCGSIGKNEKVGAALKAGTWGVAGTSHIWTPNYEDGAMPSRDVTSMATNIINAAHALAFTARYDWHVRVGYEGQPSVRITTDDRGVRDLFSNRDIAEGDDRRTALKHWVGQHWRRLPLDEGETETLVRRYLRGEVSFSWAGFHCALEPSEFDLDKNEELRKARSAMKKEQTRRKGGARR